MQTINKSKVVFLSTCPPTECGIATFTSDLVSAINNGFGDSIEPVFCNLTPVPKSSDAHFNLNPKDKDTYSTVANQINEDPSIKLVHIQHEFGLFGGTYGNYILDFLDTIKKPVAITFHSVIPNPNMELKSFVKLLTSYVSIIFVMTKKSQFILNKDYAIKNDKITYVPHGTHIVNYVQPSEIKKKFNLENRVVLSTFGLLSSGKNIETALKALPKIIAQTPNVLYLILGKSHPNTTKNGHDDYRDYLKKVVELYKLSDHVKFIDRYLEIEELLDYLKATDLYLFTSKDPNQAVSGTFSYAMSCACPMVATSIPHTREVLTPDVGIIVDIEAPEQFSEAVNSILKNDSLRKSMAIKAFQKTRESSWCNVAVKHINTYNKHIDAFETLQFKHPLLNLNHIKRLTTRLGIIQFSKISQPDISSGYTLDDNARALIAMCMHYEHVKSSSDLVHIDIYLSFIERCQTPSGTFINYLDKNNNKHIKNDYVNLEDSNARAIWALGTLINLKEHLPITIVNRARLCLLNSTQMMQNTLSPRAIGFVIKGLYLYYTAEEDKYAIVTIDKLSQNLITKYDVNAVKNWKWFENYLTYVNSILPEAMLYSYLATGKDSYKRVAIESFDFLLSKMFVNGHFKVISNQGWYKKDSIPNQYGEQPIDVSYIIQTLNLFYKTFKDLRYKTKMQTAFDWFLGKNHLNQIMYDPNTGGCYDGLEKENINLNQGAESTICYLIAHIIMEQNKVLSSRKIISLVQPKVHTFFKKI